MAGSDLTGSGWTRAIGPEVRPASRRGVPGCVGGFAIVPGPLATLRVVGWPESRYNESKHVRINIDEDHRCPGLDRGLRLRHVLHCGRARAAAAAQESPGSPGRLVVR